MIKIILTLIICITTVVTTKAQQKIKDGSVSGTGILPQARAILDLESNNKALYLPRLTTTQRNAQTG